MTLVWFHETGSLHKQMLIQCKCFVWSAFNLVLETPSRSQLVIPPELRAGGVYWTVGHNH